MTTAPILSNDRHKDELNHCNRRRAHTVELAPSEHIIDLKLALTDTFVNPFPSLNKTRQAKYTRLVLILRIYLEMQVFIPNGMLSSLDIDFSALTAPAQSKECVWRLFVQ